MSNNTGGNAPSPRAMSRWLLLAAGLAIAALYAMQGQQGNPPAAPPAAPDAKLAASDAKSATPDARSATGSAGGTGASGGLDRALATGAMRELVIHSAPRTLPDFTVLDGEGRQRRLAEWRGQVLLVNFWATWCPPCRREMPHIAALQKTFAGQDFRVIAISEDTRGYDWAKRGLKLLGADNLFLLWDEGGKALRALRERGLPVTLLVDRQGREVARLIGPADWNSAQAQAIIRALLAQK